MKNRLSNSKGLIILLGVFAFVFLTDVGLVILYYRYIDSFVSHQPKDFTADAGVVFFGDYTEDGNALGPDSRRRADKTVALYRSGKIKNIICVGGYDYRHWSGKPHYMKEYMVEQGIPLDRITVDSLSFNTITNWREAEKIIRRNGYESIAAISAPLHIFRISGIIDSDSVYYCAYTYQFNGFRDYRRFYQDVHHEWASHFLSFALREEVRNRLVYFVRTVMNEVGKVL